MTEEAKESAVFDEEPPTPSKGGDEMNNDTELRSYGSLNNDAELRSYRSLPGSFRRKREGVLRDDYVHYDQDLIKPRYNTDLTTQVLGRVSVSQQKKTYEDEYARLSLRFERGLIEHKLALQYFEFRSFYCVFLPVTIIATLITIIGFLISGSGTTQDGDEAAGGSLVEFDPLLTGNSKQKWSLVVGILGATATLFNAIGKRTNYQSQSDMHRSAVKALEKIGLTLDFERDWFNRNASSIRADENRTIRDSAGREKLANKLGADLKSHQASFKAMIDACCDSPVPYQVDQAFTLLDQVFFRDCKLRGVSLSDAETDLMFFYHKLWKKYSTYRWWPLKAPSRVFDVEIYSKWKEEFDLADLESTYRIADGERRKYGTMMDMVDEEDYMEDYNREYIDLRKRTEAEARRAKAKLPIYVPAAAEQGRSLFRQSLDAF